MCELLFGSAVHGSITCKTEQRVTTWQYKWTGTTKEYKLRLDFHWVEKFPNLATSAGEKLPLDSREDGVNYSEADRVPLLLLW
ncbi:hypothetical protein J6590_040212 [Homalodisca vitripennis]|nr:hypothetical protein J6590_040212 [Homalodisca vitripennis]